ncbi:gamma-glutamyl-gamma-aminobutyrate hydrolase family protein [Oceanobacillus sp. CAU 1775]
MTLKPLIGITAGFVKNGDYIKGNYVHQDFINSVVNNGGIPIIISYNHIESAVEILKLCDGLIVTGGEDVSPEYYNEEPHQNLGVTTPIRDVTEMTLVKYALESDLPLLAVCRGIQVLNVTLNGTLYQDIPSSFKESYQHFQKGSELYKDTHWINVAKGSHLYEIFKKERVRVNSFHHQSIKQLGDGLKVTAKSSDGIIECVEYQENSFALGVQFHPEFMASTNQLMNRLFKSLVEASKKS